MQSWNSAGRASGGPTTRKVKESEKQERYAREQCDLLRTLEDLAATERTMYELDNRKDQVMTECLARSGQWGGVEPRSLFSCQLCPRHLGTAGSLLPTQGSGRFNAAHGLC